VPRAKQRTPELRDRVLQVAVSMLADEGFGGFTTRKVAQGAATSVPAVYELFGDKAGLVREVFFEGFRQLRRRFDQLKDPGRAWPPGSSHATLYLRCASRGGAGDDRTGGPWPAQGVPR